MNENQPKDPIPDQTSPTDMPLLAAKGFCMGAADVVPGVSGGTMALILGIYLRLIDAIKSFDIIALRDALSLRLASLLSRVHWKFMLSLLAGISAALIFFTRVVALPELIQTHPEPVYGLFFGLILGSIWFVFRDSGINHPGMVLWIVVGILVGWRLVTLMPASTPEHPMFIFFTGMIAISAMILPGISGSFILLIMRKYEYIFSQFARLGGGDSLEALLILVPFGLGMIAGIVVFSRLLSWLLHRWRTATYLLLAGFMIGSLWLIWPWQERVLEDGRMITSSPVPPPFGTPGFSSGVVMILVGAALVAIIEMLGRKQGQRVD